MKFLKELLNRFVDFITEVLHLEENVENLGTTEGEKEGGHE